MYVHRRWLVVMVSLIWVILISAILKPMGMALITNKMRAASILIIITAFALLFVMYALPAIFKKFYAPNNWTFGKFLSIPAAIVFIVSPLAAVATYYISTSENIPITISPVEQLAIWYVRSSFLSLFPTMTFFFLYRNVPSDPILNNEIHVDQGNNESGKGFVVLSGNTKESLQISPQDFLYAEVLGNYVTVYYLSDNEVQQKSIRTTLQQILEDLDIFPQFVRCHRAFIVNISNITNVKGNSHAYKLSMKNLNTEVPVSKSYTKLIKEKLNL